jgi:hypothetical protein
VQEVNDPVAEQARDRQKELTMATWMWLNIPLLVLAFAMTVGLSYLVVLSGRRKAAGPVAVPVPVRVTTRPPADHRIAA